MPAAPVWVDGDPMRLTQVVSNLLHNAAKFTDRGGSVAVRLTADAAAGRAEVSVRDTGIGMEPAMIGRLFEAFSQADRSLDRSQGRAGAGPGPRARAGRLHGGDVRASSPGPGAGRSSSSGCRPRRPPRPHRLPSVIRRRRPTRRCASSSSRTTGTRPTACAWCWSWPAGTRWTWPTPGRRGWSGRANSARRSCCATWACPACRASRWRGACGRTLPRRPP